MIDNPVLLVFFACYFVAIWDCMLLLPTEYRQIWCITDCKRQGFASALYMCCRYYTLVAMGICLWQFSSTSEPVDCEQWGWGIPLLCGIVVWFCDFVIAMNTFAIWGQKKWVGVVLSFAWICEVVMMSIAVSHYTTIPELTGQPGPCIAVENLSGKPALTLMSWIAPLMFTLIAFALTAIKMYVINKSGWNSTLSRQLWHGRLLYVAVVLLIYLLNLIFFLQPNVNIQALAAAPAFLIPSLMSCRMILVLRSNPISPSSSPTPPSPPSPQISGIQTYPTTSTDITNTNRGSNHTWAALELVSTQYASSKETKSNNDVV